MTLRALFLVATILIAGNAIAASGSSSPTGPLAYKDGWQDGCTSAYFASGNIEHAWKHDVARSTFDKLYKSGWTHGFLACKEGQRQPIKTLSS